MVKHSRRQEARSGANKNKTSPRNDAQVQLQGQLTLNGRHDAPHENPYPVHKAHENLDIATLGRGNKETQIQGPTRKKLPNSRQRGKKLGPRASSVSKAKRPHEPLATANPALKTRAEKKRRSPKSRRLLQDKIRASIERLNVRSQHLSTLQSTVEALSAQIATIKDNEAELRCNLERLLE
ncbi:hypothetical protein CDD82_6694 [Ophiocordyceps australis]|uniref:Uncharacterized protein n=1 Tax=Ophiocordyceps australis TaxID=1399860 RepID=A0A2C5ZMB7_9HYPO|nr:hypothetical protein CDD82_6694 [Ophiocordyceps australis]